MKNKLLVVANLRFNLYAQLLFLILNFFIFWSTVIYVIKAKWKSKWKSKLLFVANLKLHLYGQLLFLITHFSIFWDTVIRVIKAKCEINKIYVIKAKYQLLVIANLLIYNYVYMLNYFVL